MLINALSPALDHAVLTCVLTKLDDGRVSLVVAPKPKGKGTADTLEQPIMLTGTVEELDAELTKGSDGALGLLATGYTSLAEQVQRQAAALEEARVATAARSAAKKAAPPAQSRPATSTAERAKALAESSAPAEAQDAEDEVRLF